MNNYDEYYNYNNGYYSNINSLAEPYNAFIKGNLFNNLYSSYKSYKPVQLSPSSEQEYALMLVQMYDFCAHELTLYLDNYPDDANVIALRDQYIKSYKTALNQYESKFGPITLDSLTLGKTPWGWDTQKWPWEGSR